jgi:hypothetical protein
VLGRRPVRALVACAFAVLAIGAVPPVAADPAGGPVTVAATLNATPIGGHTVVIDPARTIGLAVTVGNPTNSVIHVHSVRLVGTALALTFFDYDTTVTFDVPAHGRTSRTLTLDLSDLDGQAVGLLPASVEVLDAGKTVLARASTVTDIRGSITSVYGVFGIAVLILTILAWATALLAMARRTLPANRWRRALRFLPAGFGTGIVAVITLSVLRLVAPAPAIELPVIACTAAIGLVLGYLTPQPLPADPTDATRETVDRTTERIHG